MSAPTPAQDGDGFGKLTKMQRRLIDEVLAGDDFCVKGYHPARSLTHRGVLEWFEDDEYSGRLRLTDAGRRALGPSHV